ncbi:hypothetical protein D3C80_883790 [compost metagenome]
MAFVSIDNPAGILHHGGQMAWDAVSDTRVVMLTFTKDFKALIQEINYVDGAPVVGVPSFFSDLSGTTGITDKFHLRPKIKSIAGTDLVFAMVPSAFSSASSMDRQYHATGSAATFAYMGTPSRLKMPTAYTGYILERDSNGRYTVKSSAPVPIPYGGVGSRVFTNFYSIYIEEATPTSIRVRSPCFYNSYNFDAFGVITAPLDSGILSAFVLSTHNVTLTGTNTIWVAYDAKRVRDIKGNYRTLAALGSVTSSYESVANRSVAAGNYDVGNYRYIPLLKRNGSQSSSIGENYCTDCLPAGTVYIDGDISDRTYYATGHSAVGQNTMIATTQVSYLAGTVPVFAPLDTGFVHSSGIVCSVGGYTSRVSWAVFDVDLAHSIELGGDGLGSANPLRLSFRQLSGIGHYAGPYDPIQTPYYYNMFHNNNQILHKVNDTQFWLIGCFMDSPTADPKLGVISVSPPA